MADESSEIVVRTEGVGKWFQISESKRGADLLSERLGELIRAPLRLGRQARRVAKGKSVERRQPEGMWALRDIDLELRAGETLGLVGRNGAGKSTLLKLLSRITPPTEGRITIAGRVATLLEVGTGFHPELTGRENVYLSGAVLGMSRDETAARFDEIVDFSGIGTFLDTPVKWYSSGMYVRLGFAVAAHLDPEILLVDEVLTVGDAEFQQKSLAKLGGESTAGRTVIFVSHNLGAIQRLCSRAVFIDGGRLVADGRPRDVVADYMSTIGRGEHGGVAEIPDDADRTGSGRARVRRVVLRDERDEPTASVMFGDPLRLEISVEAFEPLKGVALLLGVSTPDGERFAMSLSIDGGRAPFYLEAGTYEIKTEVDLVLLPEEFAIDVGLLEAFNGARIDLVERALMFHVSRAARDESDAYPWKTPLGHMRPSALWSEPTRATTDELHPISLPGEPDGGRV